MSEGRVEELNRKRFALLKGFYDASEGRRDVIVNLYSLAEEIGLTKEEAHPLADWLEGEFLLKYQTFGGGTSITHEGIKQVEQALSAPDKPSDYFPPINVIYVETMEQSQIQQGTLTSVQKQEVTSIDLDQVRTLVSELRSKTDELQLGNEKIMELKAELATLEAQVNSPKPKNGIIAEVLASIRSILESATGKVAATYLLELISRSS